MKKFLNLFLVLGCLVVFTGCSKSGEKESNKTTSINYILNTNGTISIDVLTKDDGNPKYEFTTTKPEGMKRTGTVYLETDKAILAFSTTIMTYHTATKYKDKYGDVKPTFEDYLKWMDDPDSGIKLAGIEKLDINSRKALRYYSREGGSGDYTYYGYTYLIGAEDIYNNSRITLAVQYKETEFPKEAKELDEETLSIIKSLKITKSNK